MPFSPRTNNRQPLVLVEKIPMTRLRQHKYLILATCLGFTSILLDLVSAFQWARVDSSSSTTGQFFSANELPVELSLGPLTRTRNVSLRWDNHNYNLNASSQWETLFPSGKGLFYSGNGKRNVQIAMYQHLECLNILRLSFLRVYDPLEHPTPNEFWQGTDECLHHLRQVILCASDTTLDPTFPTYLNDSVGFGSSAMKIDGVGLGTYHRCRDWTAVRRLAENLSRDREK